MSPTSRIFSLTADQLLDKATAKKARRVRSARATLADWVGHVAWWVMPLAELIGAHVMAAPVIHTDASSCGVPEFG